MPNLESKPLTTSIKFDPGHNLEMRADLAAKTAEVENLVTGEMYTGGGGDSDFGAAEVTITNNTEYAVSVYGYLELTNIGENLSIIGTAQSGTEVTDTPVNISTYYDVNKHAVMIVDGASSIINCVGCEVVYESDGSFTIAIITSEASFAAN